jgi:hypothetical protein
MQDQDMNALLNGQERSPNQVALDPTGAGFQATFDTGLMDPYMSGANQAYSDTAALENGMATSTPGVVGIVNGGAGSYNGVGGEPSGGRGASALTPACRPSRRQESRPLQLRSQGQP